MKTKKKVSDVLYRGPRPKSFRELMEMGITKDINLESGVYEGFHEDGFEKELACTFGVIEFNIPLSDFTPPKYWQVVKVLHIILNLPGIAYLHCLHGADRTGFICAVYRMVIDGWSYEDAVKEMFQEGFHKFPYLIWLPELKKYEKLTGQVREDLLKLYVSLPKEADLKPKVTPYLLAEHAFNEEEFRKTISNKLKQTGGQLDFDRLVELGRICTHAGFHSAYEGQQKKIDEIMLRLKEFEAKYFPVSPSPNEPETVTNEGV